MTTLNSGVVAVIVLLAALTFTGNAAERGLKPNTQSFLRTAMRFAMPEESLQEAVFEDLDQYGGMDEMFTNIYEDPKHWASWPSNPSHNLEELLPRQDKRYSEFPGKRSGMSFSLPYNKDTLMNKRWTEFVGKRQDADRMQKRFMEFVGKRQQKRYKEFIG